jgi:hypothetical protein
VSELDVVKSFMGLIESKDLQGLEDILADDFSAKGPTMQLNKGQGVAYFNLLFTAFPDISYGVPEYEQKGDLIFCTIHEKGTHTGTLDLKPFGMPVTLAPTGKRFALPEGKLVFRVEGDKISSLSEQAVVGGGLAGVLAQLGVKIA